MNEREQQIETLIGLVELNLDRTWIDEFRSLRTGGFLPGGGAGSLNDWGPAYSDETANVWYSNLYRILRYLFDNSFSADDIRSFKPIRLKNSIRIIRCMCCGESYQHPSSFEAHIALDFYETHLPKCTKNQQLNEMLEPNRSFESPQVNTYRIRLAEQYKSSSISVYDFVSAEYVCPHCEKAGCDTEHDLYKVTADDTGKPGFVLVKRNAVWEDFETEIA